MEAKGYFDAPLSPGREDEAERERKEFARTAARKLEAAKQEAGKRLMKADAVSIKAHIAQELQAGGPPEYILHNAVMAIGLLSDDMEWAAPLLAGLEETYGDMVQQGLWVTDATEKALKLETRQIKYREKLKKRVTTLLNEYQRVEMDMRSILRTVEQMEETDKETK